MRAGPRTAREAKDVAMREGERTRAADSRQIALTAGLGSSAQSGKSWSIRAARTFIDTNNRQTLLLTSLRENSSLDNARIGGPVLRGRH